MKNVKNMFVALLLPLVLCGGLFVSCVETTDDSSVMAYYAQVKSREQSANDFMALNNIGVMISISSSPAGSGAILEKLNSRRYSDDTKRYAVLTFVATQAEGRVFHKDKVEAKADSAAVTPSFGATTDGKTEFTVTVPIGTSVVYIRGTGVFSAPSN